MKLISIRSFRFTESDYLRESRGVAYRTIASATLAIHRSLVNRKHFALNLTSLVPENGDFLLVKVYAKTRETSEKLDEFIEFPSVLVNSRDGVTRRDVAHPITKQMRDICTNLVWNQVRAHRAKAA